MDTALAAATRLDHDLTRARGILYDATALADRDLFTAWRRFASDLDHATVYAAVGALSARPAWFANGRFDLEEVRGVEPATAIVCEAIALDGVSTVDLVAWPVNEPRQLATFAGRAVMLGENQALAHPSKVFCPPLRVHRTAAAWLRAGCDGCVPLKRIEAARLFLDIGGQIRAEDDAHGAELDDARREMVRRGASIVVADAA